MSCNLSARVLSALLPLVLLAGPAHGGPPWIAIELPANPHHASTRNASMLIRAYHHSTSIEAPIAGVAQGIVDGRRVSLALQIRPTNQPGVYAVHTPLPKGGTWVLALTLSQSKDDTATALVTVDAGGRIVAVDVPSDRSRDGWTVPRRVTDRDIEAALQAAHIAYGGTPTAPRSQYALALPLLLLTGVAVAGASRARRGR
jgi:hypothetical protein